MAMYPPGLMSLSLALLLTLTVTVVTVARSEEADSSDWPSEEGAAPPGTSVVDTHPEEESGRKGDEEGGGGEAEDGEGGGLEEDTLNNEQQQQQLIVDDIAIGDHAPQDRDVGSGDHPGVGDGEDGDAVVGEGEEEEGDQGEGEQGGGDRGEGEQGEGEGGAQDLEQPKVNYADRRTPLDMQADYQEIDSQQGGGGGGGHCLQTTEDPLGEIICEKWADEEEEEDPVTKYKASRDGSVGSVPILIAIITAGVICFILGFFINRYHSSSTRKHQVFTPKPIVLKPLYAETPTEPPDEEDYKPAPVPTKPITPEIIYTSHDEPDVQVAPPDVILKPPPSANKRQQQARQPMPPIGKYQSPINIEPDEAELSDDLEKGHLVFNYVPENTKSLTNLGNTVKVMVDCRGSDLHGGPLGDDRRYCLDHFRFRWGADDTRGSEHSVAGKRYAGEIQLVHWNKEDFRTYSEASRYESGLAIVSVFMNVTEEQHTSLQTLLDVFKSIKYKGESVEVPHHYFDPASLLPGNTLEYWTYPGSLTESPYPETVTWLVLKEPINVSASQMAHLRGLLRCERDEAHGTAGDEQLVDNFREQSALGDRRVTASFH